MNENDNPSNEELRHNKEYRVPEDPKPPNMWQMAKNFSSSLAEYLAKGAPNVTTVQYLERLDICNNCPKLIRKSMRCGQCGCLLEHKAKWKTTTCPDDPPRWPSVIGEGEEPPKPAQGMPESPITNPDVWNQLKK